MPAMRDLIGPARHQLLKWSKLHSHGPDLGGRRASTGGNNTRRDRLRGAARDLVGSRVITRFVKRKALQMAIAMLFMNA
jgi:hypothetical protein